MDPVTAAVVAAIAAGAVTGVSDTAAQAVNDAYAGLKSLLSGRYGGVDVSGVERKPESEAKKASLAEDLADAGAAGDAELGKAAAAVLEAVHEHAPQSLVGVDVEGLRAGALTIADVASAGDGARVRDSEIAGTVDIRGIRAGVQEPPRPRPARD
ncbi:hypothetical protein ACWESM_14415 [Nocardia sp. NPDC003999]